MSEERRVRIPSDGASDGGAEVEHTNQLSLDYVNDLLSTSVLVVESSEALNQNHVQDDDDDVQETDPPRTTHVQTRRYSTINNQPRSSAEPIKKIRKTKRSSLAHSKKINNIISPQNIIPIEIFQQYLKFRLPTLFESTLNSERQTMKDRIDNLDRKQRREILSSFDKVKYHEISMDATLLLREGIVNNIIGILRKSVQTVKSNNFDKALALEASRAMDSPAIGLSEITSISERRDRELNNSTSKYQEINHADVIVIDDE